MNDGQRQYPVDYFFLHHSTGPEFVNAEDVEVQDWYSNTGKARAYENGAINPMHEHPSRPGQLTYAQAQFTLREYTNDGNKYGWRLTDLIARPWQNVAWAVGNWSYNIKSSSVEICGNYINRDLPDKACMLLADFLREIDQELVQGGYPGGINVWLHNEVYATQCPAGIANQRDKIVDMINNPAKWNEILWPTTPPTPVVTYTDITNEVSIPFATVKLDDDTLEQGTEKVKTPGENGVRTIFIRVTYTDGVETGREIRSENITKNPVTEVVLVGTKVPTPDPEVPETPSDWLTKLITWIVELVQKIIGKK